ncbi:hypothetical protein [Falsiroseomonas sp. HW251]|uniref:hypothetical protein n=1 Tax=Falsiroseomonas sp. HW251 TaxID=3390998 RepID=UPI003D30FD5F
MSNDLTFPANPFLAPWLRAAQAAGGLPAEMMRRQVEFVTAWNRQALALMTGAWAKPAAMQAIAPKPVPAFFDTAPLSVRAPVRAPVEAPVEAAAEVVETVAETTVDAAVAAVAKPARKPKAAQLRAAPQRRKATKKAPAKKPSRVTRH